MANKIDIDKQKAGRLINYGPVTLVTSSFREQKNVASVAWAMPVSASPGLVAIAVTNKRFTYELIRESREFIINIPSQKMKEAVIFCGSTCGRELDKFSKAGLTPANSKKLDAPIVQECFAHIECKVVNEVLVGDHMLFVGDVIAVYADEGVMTANGTVDIEKFQPLIHLGAKEFAALKKI
ncbi:MAG: flavin reductase family protein [Candidatus Margulisiibacteriota bacterium]